jgi:predicted nucleic acid-binding protein
VLKAAAENDGNGWGATSFLLEQTGKTNKITEEVVKAAVGNTTSARDILELLITHKAENFVITEGVIMKALLNRYGGVDLVQFLLEAEVDSFVITEGLVEELVRSFRPTLAALLIKERGNEVFITERVVKAAYANRWCGQEVRDLLLEHQRMNPKPPASSDPLKQWWKRGAS